MTRFYDRRAARLLPRILFIPIEDVLCRTYWLLVAWANEPRESK